MIFNIQNCLRNVRFCPSSSIFYAFFCASSVNSSHAPFPFVASTTEPSQLIRTGIVYQDEQPVDLTGQSDVDTVIRKVYMGSCSSEVFQCLKNDKKCDAVPISNNLVDKLLHRFKDSWKAALGVFRWAGSCPGYKHTPEAYDMMVDILGKTKQMDRMLELLGEMQQDHLITLNTVSKVMRRFAGAGQWEDAVKTFDELGTLGLEKNTESMNLLLDTLCKEGKVEKAREIFLELKSYISPNAHTFNILIHGWCKVNRIDEAQWTIQEMKGLGYRPCVISYSTIIQFYCCQCNFSKVYELLDEMETQGYSPNVVTYTTVMSSLTKSKEFEEALLIAERMKSNGCKPDVLFYNSFIHTLGKVGRPQEAVHVFKVEMPKMGVAPNTSTYNSMIAMFCNHGQEQVGLNLLREMETLKICKPDVQTYYPLLKSCLKTGKTGLLLGELLDDMVNKHHLSLDISAYTLLVHGLCKANKCEWAYRLFEEMIGQDIMPRYHTCHLLWDAFKQHNMYDAAERIEDVMKKL